MVQLEVDKDPADVATLRAYVHSIGALFGLSKLAVEGLVFVASELVSNAIQHARTGSVITLRRSGNLLRVSVADYSTKPPLTRSAKARRLSGLGLVEALSWRWGWTEHGNTGKTVWATLDVRRR
jgi:anti-sigma regulatory factor (Ser/Thr protein kinase)